MTKHVRNILKGIGSVMDISPNNDYGRFVPKDSSQKRMQGHWERTGNAIKFAADKFAYETKEK